METYENHEAFNKHLSMFGYRPTTNGTTPSNYITKVKLRRAIKEIPDRHIEDLFDNEMSQTEIKAHREKLNKKIEKLLHWQLMVALNILLRDGNYDAIEFVLKSKRSDKENN
ncbi:MAG: hypothetical protein ACXVNO_01480 [Bacteroidia bacterium]